MSTAIAERDDQTDQNPAALVQLAVKSGANVEQLERLMAMQERYEARQAKKEFVAALQAFKSKPPRIVKNHAVAFGSGDRKTAYKHATLDNVCGLLGPALAEHDLSFTWETQNLENGIIRVTCVLTHAAGHSERTALQAVPDTSGSKNPIQAVGSTVTYLQRYTLLAACGIAVQGADDDGRQGAAADEPIDEKQATELVKLLNDTKADWDSFLAYFRVSDVKEIRKADYNRAVEMLNKKKASRR